MGTVGSGSLFSVKDFQNRGVDQVLNVYWYYGTFAPDTVPATEIVTLWEAIFGAWLPDVQPLVVKHDLTEVEEVTSISNFTTQTSTLTDGILAGTELASYQAASFHLLRTDKSTRSGWKRIAAGTEENIAGNDWNVGLLATMDNLAAVMNDPLVSSAGNVEPVIVRKTRDAFTGELLSPTLWLWNIVSNVEAQRQVTTQNTRKRGRGA